MIVKPIILATALKILLPSPSLAFKYILNTPAHLLGTGCKWQVREVRDLRCAKKEYWSPIEGPDDFSDNISAELGIVDESLLVGMGNDQIEHGVHSTPEEYSESLQEMFKEAKDNFDKLLSQMKGDKLDFEKPITQDGLREFRSQAGSGIQSMIDRDLNKALEYFNAAKSANSTQILLQRGMTLFFIGNYEEAAIQFEQDVESMENRNLKLFKATDARLWWSAALLAQGLEKEAKDALDIYNDELEESRFIMKMLLRYYHGDMPLQDLVCIIGDTDDKDVLGNSFYGNFYLALRLIASGEKDMAKAFLDLICDSENFDEKDLWRHLPGLLHASVV